VRFRIRHGEVAAAILSPPAQVRHAIANICVPDTRAVVGQAENEPAGIDPDVDRDRGRPRMFDHIGQCFAEYGQEVGSE